MRTGRPNAADRLAQRGRSARAVMAFAAAAALAAASLAGSARAQGGAGIDYAHTEIKITKLADNLYVFVAGPGLGNVVVLTGPDGVLMIDSMYPQMHDKLMAAIRALSPGPIRYVINTHLHGDHSGGNGLMVREGAAIIAQDNVRKRMEMVKPASAQPAYPPQDVPTITYGDSMTLRFDGEEVYVFHPPPAHTDGDSIVYFKHANVMHVGDLPASLRFNNIGVDDGGGIDGMIADGRLVMKVANPQTRIVAGHLGPVVGFKEIQEQEVMFQTVRDRVARMIGEGKTLEQAVAAKPTREFDTGRMGGTYTPDRWVALVYTDLSRRLKK